MQITTIEGAKASLVNVREQHERALKTFNPMIAADAAKKGMAELLPLLDFVVSQLEKRG
ncbi:hypothetical protein [Vibrio viridaestus]|uniref:hypothetical protein n=1 Tax=Vibrio viridaestus TaxID=2487322 RepID=UPI00140E9238|nr:hypothetical protein [Vibrio viridaestus]